MVLVKVVCESIEILERHKIKRIEKFEMSNNVFEQGKVYTLLGLVNAPTEIAQIPFRKGVRLRIALQIGMRGSTRQTIVEIDNNSRCSIPKTAPNYASPVQLMIIRNCLFVETNFIKGKNFSHFKVMDLPNRFVWISNPRKDFWQNSIDSNCLERSSGSVFGKTVESTEKDFFISQLIDGYTLQEWAHEAYLIKEESLVTAKDGEDLSKLPMQM